MVEVMQISEKSDFLFWDAGLNKKETVPLFLRQGKTL